MTGVQTCALPISDGELLAKYQPPPMVASFMQEPGVAQRTAIPVPKGPVEVW